MNNMEVVERLAKVYNELEEIKQTIDAIDIALFDAALSLVTKEDLPDLDIDGMKEVMNELKQSLFEYDDETSEDDKCDDVPPEFFIPHIGDEVAIIDGSGVKPNSTKWVFDNINDRELIVKYAYGVIPEASNKSLKVVGYDDDRKNYYVLDEEKDECYIVESNCIAKKMSQDEAIAAMLELI